MSPDRPAGTAAIVTVGTELTSGIAVDTNTAEIAQALDRAALDVVEAVSVADEEARLAATLRRLVATVDVVIVTGGLGPTHDDVTRSAAALALGVDVVRDPALETMLAPWAARHGDRRSSEQVYVQADVLAGARVIPPTRGTAPGQVMRTGRGMLALLPGPPAEMRPMLRHIVAELAGSTAPPVILRCTGLTESDVAMAVNDSLEDARGVSFTVLAMPGDVRAVLHDRGAGADGLAALARAAASRIGSACYSADGSTLAEVVLSLARDRGVRIAVAESCTGGLVSAALTAVPGSSSVFAGGVVAYSNEAKTALISVQADAIDFHGAVSEEVAEAMAVGSLMTLRAGLSVAVTGIAGPEGGTADKPVGTVWFATASGAGTRTEMRHFPGDRDAVRQRATAAALDLLRRRLLEG